MTFFYILSQEAACTQFPERLSFFFLGGRKKKVVCCKNRSSSYSALGAQPIKRGITAAVMAAKAGAKERFSSYTKRS